MRKSQNIYHVIVLKLWEMEKGWNIKFWETHGQNSEKHDPSPCPEHEKDQLSGETQNLLTLKLETKFRKGTVV